MIETKFRFQDFEIWQHGAAVSGILFKLAGELANRKMLRFAEHLRGATLSIINNIAEGSEIVSDVDFANFLNNSRRSVLEVANVLLLFARKGCLPVADVNAAIAELKEQS